ncbi:NAD-dependent succinate-semialdehyde dehydrogenase [Rhodococcus sp. T2V]|uniref:NAD-dependent succinate-semialdehyde dehydrogenase n=1 Tax=Rhodococcus sp. T2V TaxID=3034164 RepID=UPI0023E16A2C|nr:NAD-dependent succinate-semialdehyde dehydrogenase [Rhodococcus sp. T2V]MDF3311449.1 NAD-dependent succinate-semialdehyde dehydrogenase [Rhodococcus sp. T2V]
MQSLSASSNSSYRVTNPATGAVVESFTAATDTEVEAALASAHEGFGSWRQRSTQERAAIVKRIGQLFTEKAEILGRIITEEMGKPLSQAVGEARFCTEIFDYFADNGEKLLADQEIDTAKSGRAVIQRRPVGPLLGIMPWNYPYYQVARFAAPNLVLGNTIVLKHAESCPRSALAIKEIMDEAGLPDGVYNNLFATHEQIAVIISDPRVQGVSLTGSERAGAIIGQLAGKNLKKAVLELGGSDPYVVLDTDDVKAEAAAAWRMRLHNMGQACNSNKRIVVMDEIYDEFIDALVQLARGLKPGDPTVDEDSTYAPMSSREAAETLNAQVMEAVAKGATLHAGGTLVDGRAAYYAPAVLTGVTAEMEAYSQELFGPVAVVYRARSEQEALELANDTAFGLGAAVFSTDPERARNFAEKFEVGMANVNVPAAQGAEFPFGGVKRSGFGRELGPLGMEEFVNKRLLYIHPARTATLA